MTRLQYVRRAIDISQSELAKRSGVSIRTIQALEIGARDIDKASVVTVLKLAQALGCKIEDIIEYGNEGWEDE